MESNRISAPSLRATPRNISPRQRIAAALLAAGIGSATALKTSSVEAQPAPTITSPRPRLVPVYLVPVNSPRGRLLEENAAANGQQAPTPTLNAPTANDMNFSGNQPTAPTVVATPAPETPHPETSTPDTNTTPATLTTENTPSSDTVPVYHFNRGDTFAGIGLGLEMVTGMYQDPEAPANTLNVSGSHCAPELGAAGPTGRQLCNVTFSGHGDVTATGQGVEIHPGTGRNAMIIIGNGPTNTITLQDSSGTRTFNVGVNTADRTFRTQVVSNGSAPEGHTRVTFIPVVELFAGHTWRNGLSLTGIVRGGFGLTASRPNSYNFSTRLRLGYQGTNPRSIWRVGVQSGVMVNAEDGSGPTHISVPVEATLTVLTSGNSRNPRVYITPTAGIHIPTDGSSVGGVFSLTAGVQY